jgi:hypothetical protein
MAPRQPRAVALSARVYRACLRAYPPAFRRAYGRDMAWVFRDACLDAYHRAGVWGVLLLWGPILRDLAANVAGEHVAAFNREGAIMVVEERGRSVWLWWAVAGALGYGVWSVTSRSGQPLDPGAVGVTAGQLLLRCDAALVGGQPQFGVSAAVAL